MTPKEKTIIQILKDTVGTIVLVIIAMGLPALLTVGICANWNDDVKFIILLLNILDAVTLFELIGCSK